MSSTKNHRIRSHRSYRNSVSAAERFQRNQVIKCAANRTMKEYFRYVHGIVKEGRKIKWHRWF